MRRFWDTARVCLEALLIAVVIRTVLFQPFNIPSGSLIPTLLVGDYLFVSKYAYGYSHHALPFSLPLFEGRFFAAEPQRGDVAVFKLPRDGKTDYIKRVIGLPGDRIQMIGGVLHINGTAVKRERIGTYPTQNPYGRSFDAPLYRETLPGGKVHQIMELEGDSHIWDNTQEYVVPLQHFFMMGDNRDNSTDSRDPSVGFVPFDNFVGRAEVLFFSTEDNASILNGWNFGQGIRWGRILQKVQ
jgi:signal peptidase I